MRLTSDKEEMIFRYENNDKVSYAKSISHKLQDGTWEHGYIPVRFKKGTDLKNKTKIKILEAWDDFYIKDNRTYPYYFINKFELADDLEAIKQVSEIPSAKEIEIEPEELPFY